MTDTNSFPFELKDPDIAIINQYGAYNALSIYDQAWIKTFIEHATKRGMSRHNYSFIHQVNDKVPSILLAQLISPFCIALHQAKHNLAGRRSHSPT